MNDAVTIPDTQCFDLEARDGVPYRIFLAMPSSEPPAGGFPVIYMLDANAGFATLVEALRRAAVRPQGTGIVPAVIVGIGYPTDDIYDRARRTLDYTAGPSLEARSGGDGTAPRTGGRDAFFAFIEQVLKPEIARRCVIDPARQTLFGHSLAGYFVLDVLARNTPAFSSYVAVSPSIWWDEERLVAGLADTRKAPVRLSIMVGEWEQALAPWQSERPEAFEMKARRARRAMVDRAKGFAELASWALGPSATVQFAVMPYEDHASILPIAVTRALRFVLASGSPPPNASVVSQT